MTALRYRNKLLKNQELAHYNLADIDIQLRALLDACERADVERLQAAICSGRIHGADPYLIDKTGCILAHLSNREAASHTGTERFHELRKLAFDAARKTMPDRYALAPIECFITCIERNTLPFKNSRDRNRYYTLSYLERAEGREELSFLQFVVESYMKEKGWF